MDGQFSRRGFLQAGGAAAVSFLAGCGMILHPERRNQPPGGDLDWSIVALDGLGLLLFFIPGVISFAVDFSTGAIFFPPDEFSRNESPAEQQALVTVNVPREELSHERLEQIASEHVGRDVRLVDGEYQTERLAKISDFWPTRKRLLSLRG